MIRDEIITVLSNCSAVAVVLRNRIIASVTRASDETLHGYINGRNVSWNANGNYGSTEVESPFDIVELHTDEISFSKHSAVSSVSEIVPGSITMSTRMASRGCSEQQKTTRNANSSASSLQQETCLPAWTRHSNGRMN